MYLLQARGLSVDFLQLKDKQPLPVHIAKRAAVQYFNLESRNPDLFFPLSPICDSVIPGDRIPLPLPIPVLSFTEDGKYFSFSNQSFHSIRLNIL